MTPSTCSAPTLVRAVLLMLASALLLIGSPSVAGTATTVAPTFSIGAPAATTRDSTLRFGYDDAATLAPAASTGSGLRSASSGVLLTLQRSRGTGSRSLLPIRLAAKAGTDLVKYDADALLGRLAGGNPAKASELESFGRSQGWARSQSATGPIKYTDENGVVRLTIKSGSARTPGSNFPHVEIRNAGGQRVDPYGNLVNRKSPGNHTPIDWDLP